MFVVGGVSGLSLGNSELAVAVHDTYFVVGHFHYVLSRVAIVVVDLILFFLFFEMLLLVMFMYMGVVV